MWVERERKLNKGPDSMFPNGALYDNNSSKELIKTLEAQFGNYSLLDLGCAGGQWVIDHYIKKHIALGIDGSDTPLKNPNSPGHLNWKEYNEILFWNADISFPFTVLNENGIVQFDVITAWEVLEHLPQNGIKMCMENIHKHLKKDGIFLATICTVSNYYKGVEYHQSVFDRHIWIEFILNRYFHVEKYPYTSCPRMDAAPGLDLTSNDSIAVLCRKRHDAIY